ncbi:elongation factor G [uncultured Luteimonas sp.]|uniref:elongation factor G n=1 Tax=uncultured Luteimonas sp. TaxID=453144 RepID=UPI0026246D0F|nr:elongation factor G [uncultured Luteimonas sp.]
MPHSTQQIRNVALAGHPGAGKTTLFEALLHAGGAIQTAGTIERGSTVSDFDPIEKQRGHSIDAAIASMGYAAGDGQSIHLNLVDLPGYPDFRGPALAALAVVETALVVVDAAGGVEYGTRRLMERARERGLCRAIVVNRIDADGADPGRVLDLLRQNFGPEVLPLNLPADGGTRVVDCFGSSEGDSDLGPVANWHRRILDQVVEINETVMDHYLELGEGGLSGDELHDAFEQCLREGHLVPVCFVSARTGVGVQALLDIAAGLFPHPGEANPPPFLKGRGADARPIATTPDPDAHVIADVFRIVHDPFVGKLGVFRVYQGCVRKDSQLFVDDGRKPFKVGHLFRLHGREHVEIDQAVPGDIVAIAKVEDLHFDAVLHDSHDEDHIHLAPVAFPRPMFGLAVSAGSRGQEQKLATALHRLAEEDPCFQVEHEEETNETVIRGLSDLHLRVNLERLRDRFGVEVDTRPPRIAYRETISIGAEGHHRHKKQTGGAGQFGEVALRVEPLPRGAGFEFVDEVKGGVIPGQFLPAVEKGVRQVLRSGAISGHPMQDLRVVVHDGKHHPVDSKEVAFIAAGKKAFLDAVGKARPQVLEPIVDLAVHAPESAMGDISGSLAGKRARINGTDATGNGEIAVSAQVPLSELEGYAAELKSITAGRGRYSLDFSHYEAVPPQVQQALVEAYAPRHEDD